MTCRFFRHGDGIVGHVTWHDLGSIYNNSSRGLIICCEQVYSIFVYWIGEVVFAAVPACGVFSKAKDPRKHRQRRLNK